MVILQIIIEYICICQISIRIRAQSLFLVAVKDLKQAATNLKFFMNRHLPQCCLKR